MKHRMLNGFDVHLFGWYFWLNVYGIGLGRKGVNAHPQWNWYRKGWGP